MILRCSEDMLTSFTHKVEIGCKSCTGLESRLRRDHIRWLQIEAGLDKASTGHTFIRDMTVLLLAPAAQGLEPRIVRGILERIEQACPESRGPSPLKLHTCWPFHPFPGSCSIVSVGCPLFSWPSAAAVLIVPDALQTC